MAPLADKIKKLLDECRILILGTEVVVAVLFTATFQQSFERLPITSKLILVAGAALVAVSLVVLIAPAVWHILVDHGEDTAALQSFATTAIEVAMAPFALGLGAQFYVAFAVVTNTVVAVIAGLAAIVIAAFFWYILEWLRRSGPGRSGMPRDEAAPTDIHKKVDHVLQEARMALPGAQALLGFQFSSFLTSSFDKLPAALKAVHLASLCIIGLCTVLLIAPAAWHRIVEAGEDSERFHGVASRFLLAAIGVLGAGLALELAVVTWLATHSTAAAIAAAITLAIVCYGLWFVFMLRRRALHERRPH